MNNLPVSGRLGGIDAKDATTTGRQASSRFLSVELRGQPRLLASVRLRMPSGLEADLPEGLAIEDIVRLLKGLFWDGAGHTQPLHHVARIALSL